MLARSKLNSIESKISKALMNNQISHEDVINKERNYRVLKESIRMMKGQEDEKQILVNLSNLKQCYLIIYKLIIIIIIISCKNNTQNNAAVNA